MYVYINTYHSSVGERQYKFKAKYLRGKRGFIKSQFDASLDHKYMDEPSKSAYILYTLLYTTWMDEAEPASFIAARGNIEDDESVAGDRPDIVLFSIH